MGFQELHWERNKLFFCAEPTCMFCMICILRAFVFIPKPGLVSRPRRLYQSLKVAQFNLLCRVLLKPRVLTRGNWKLSDEELQSGYQPRFCRPSCSLHNSHWPQLLPPLGTHKHSSQPSVSSCTALSPRSIPTSQHCIFSCVSKPPSLLTIVVRVFFSPLLRLSLLAPQSHQWWTDW